MKNRIALQKLMPSGWFLTMLLIIAGWSLIILFGRENPFSVFFYIGQGFLGSTYSLFSTFNKLFIYVLAALAASIPAWAGMWNVGGEGQLVLGGFMAACFATSVNTGTQVLNILLVLMFAALCGGLWALWPAWFKVRWGVNEVVTTLMGNYLIDLFTMYMVNFPLREKGSTWPRMAYIPKNYELKTIGNLDLSYTFLISVVVVAVMEIIRRYSIVGYEFQLTGKNSVFSKQGGVRIDRIKVWSMFIGGAFAGLAGGLLVLGLNTTFIAGFSPGYGNVGLLISLIGGNMPLAILGIAFSFSALQVGSLNMQIYTKIPPEITGVLQSIM
ncbi:MAG: ABC transporter permease, partial [Clostridiaceae bacterium]|nr:ABC transporter permease [Clostridiaceae bacterium]